MALPDPRDHRISLSDAAAQTRRYREQVGKDSPKSAFFFRKLLDELLAQPNCAGLRICYARTDKGEDSLVLVGVDKDGNDMVQGTLLEDGFFCPPFCGGGNALNS
jgi:hypothetical protein